MTKHRKPDPQFAICINTDDPDLLTPRMIYEVLPDESAAKSNYIRVIDNEGEDYLYPADYFVFSDFSEAINTALKKAYAKKSRTYLRWLIKREGIAEASMLKELENIRQ